MAADGRWQQAGLLVLGLWLLLSPFVLDHAPARGAAGNAHLVGGAVALLALIALVLGRLWSAWAQLALGLWLMASAFVFGDTGAAAYRNLLAVGALVLVFGLLAVFVRPAPGTLGKRSGSERRRLRPLRAPSAPHSCRSWRAR